MKIGLYSPYFDSLGGGERYTLTLASHWSHKHHVSIFWNNPKIVSDAQARFHIDLSQVSVVPNIFMNGSFLSKLFTTSRYDVIFFLSDGSIPTSCSKHSILHFQVPFQKISVAFWKKRSIQTIVCNSQFTKREIDPSVGRNATVIYPPVDIEKFSSGKKENTILSVGRFSSFFQTKKQDVLIDIFCEGMKRGILKNWKLVLAGGLLPSDQTYFKMLKEKSKGFPIILEPNISFEELKNLYARASLYWHGAGFGETNPQLMEHFGISTVEAIAAGCIPIVFNAGGQPEIVMHKKNGYLWNTKEECLEYTVHCIQSKKFQAELIREGRETIKKFSTLCFCQHFDELLDGIT